MKAYLSIFFFALVSVIAFGQQQFESGYYITSDGKRNDGQIKIRNDDWRDNPKSFEFRTDENGAVTEPDGNTVTELGLASGAVFHRRQVSIDRSYEEVGRLTRERSPEFLSETLYLRILVDGKALLYQYDQGNLHRFFYAMPPANLQQLVRKRYLTSNGEATYNEMYKQQLFNDMKCESISKSDIETLKYERDALVKLFITYNGCLGSAASTFAVEAKKETVVNLTLRPGLTYNSLNIKNLNFGGTANIENVLSFRLGLDVEVTLPFIDGSFKTFFEPVYQTFSGKISSGSVSASYSSLDLHFGLRKYFKVSSSGNLYVNVSFIYGKTLSGTVEIVSATYNVTSSVFAYGLGAGYKANRFSAEINYGTARDLLKDYNTYQGIYGGPSLILGYRILQP